MASIKKIKEKIESLSKIVDENSSLLKNDPRNLSIELTIKNLKSQIDDIQKELYHENLKREKEVINLRFKGKSAQFGTLPLSMVGGLTNNFSKAIFQASKHFQFGKKGGAKIDRIIKESIDLRLEGIGRGSTVFFLSALTSPDLFGNSIIQNSLDSTFDLLNSDSQENIIENIPKVGINSIKYFSSFFKELNRDDLELDMTWHTPNEDIKTWNGTKPKILSLYNSLNSLNLSQPEEIPFEGEIITLSLKEKFEILSTENERFYGTFPNELTEIIKQLHIGDFCKGIILKTTILNTATGKEKFEYALHNIE